MGWDRSCRSVAIVATTPQLQWDAREPLLDEVGPRCVQSSVALVGFNEVHDPGHIATRLGIRRDSIELPH